jgi:hypothetical protein
MCAAPAANGTPRTVRRSADLRHLALPTCHGRDVAARDVALWMRSGARGQLVFPDSIFKLDFLQFSKLNDTLESEAKL